MRVTPPTIARLLGISRQMAHRRIVRGDFGAYHRRHISGDCFVNEVELDAVAARLGCNFGPEQLAAAAGIIPLEANDGT